MSIKRIACIAFLFSAHYSLRAQTDSLMRMLNDSLSSASGSTIVTGTFKATHVINMQTIESPAAGALNFVIQHRFGQLNSGSYNFFGLDNASLRLGLEYGLTDRLAIGIGRSSVQKTFDGNIKYKLLRQTEGAHAVPVSLSLFGGISNYTQHYAGKDYLNANYRTAYTAQLLVARKISSHLSLQLAPTWLHYNLVPTAEDKNDVFAIGGGARMKITKRMSINAEYNYLLPNQLVSTDVHNSFSLGWDIETGGHVFQLVFSNSQSMIETQYIGQTTGRWSKGDIYFGFNISRNFNLSKKAKGRISE
jgi:opacity protein-like surface antigen